MRTFNPPAIPSGPAWCIREDSFDFARAGHSETLFTLANGYHSVRGMLELAPHYGMRGAFCAGVFDKAPVCFDKLALVPDWTDLELMADGVRFDPATCKLLSYTRTLDMRQALLFTSIRWEDVKKHRTSYASCRLVHARHKQRALLWGAVTPENWSGELALAGGIDAATGNDTHAHGGRVLTRHIVTDRFERDADGVAFEGHTGRTQIPVAVRTVLFVNDQPATEFEQRAEVLRDMHRVKVTQGVPVRFVKFAAFQGLALKQGKAESIVRRELAALQRDGVEATLRSHVAAWEKRWYRADVVIEGHDDDQAAVRFNLFHLMQSVCEKPLLDVSIAAKALHGQGYDGHIFWDTEIFMLPFFAVTDPEVAKSFLLYRYRRLPAARELARLNGYRGAQFPWQSSVTGEETTKWMSFDLVEHRWQPYKADPQHQVTASIALSVDWYRRMTGDESFHLEYGAQILIETAQFWASRVAFDGRRKKYVIRNVKCVDEFHDGVDNDAYTCYAAAENLRLGVQAARELKRRDPSRFHALRRAIGLTEKEILNWERIHDAMYFPLDAKTGMIEEFDGYFDLPDQVVEHDADGWPIQPSNVKDLYAGKTQLIKQADVVLLFFLFGNRFDPEIKRRNYHYYLARDAQGSSLSANTYAIVGLDIGERERAYASFRQSAYRDLRPSTDPLGIHAACLGGTWQAVVNGFAGARLWGERPSFKPWLPPQWRRLAFKLRWRDSVLAIDLTQETFAARVLKGKPVVIEVNGKTVQLSKRVSDMRRKT